MWLQYLRISNHLYVGEFIGDDYVINIKNDGE